MLKPKPLIVFLDAPTVDLGDVDLSALRRLGNFLALDKKAGEALPMEAQRAEVLISNKYPLGPAEMSRLPALKLIAVAATGTNNVDLVEAKRQGIAVCNVPGYSTATVVEHTILFLLSFAHRWVEHVEAVRAGDWSRSPHFALLDFPFSDLAGKTLGILGYGDIGRRVAALAKALGMKVRLAKLPGRSYRKSEKREPLKKVLAQSDYVTLHCPLTEATRGLIDAEKLSWMKPTASLLNLARGPLVVESAVAKALRAGRLAGYGADVLSEEPPSRHHPLLAKDLRDKVLLTPHVAWASRESRRRLLLECGKNIDCFRKGLRRNRVD
ncbi:MAG TPA: D-2-hydroxyacid dehydrogenase [bacterium]|nr:D-2-hydroxyacid dehydrogenase [bacterium]